MSTFSMPDLLSYADVDARLGGVLSAEFEGAGDEPDDPTVLFFDGDLTLDGDFLSAVAELRGVDADGDSDVALIVVTGDLTVNGHVVGQLTTDLAVSAGRRQPLRGGSGARTHPGGLGTHALGDIPAGHGRQRRPLHASAGHLEREARR
ncbi:hypothetical protein [Nocardia sp. CA-145437]|uniref:hypothetical protein n=1 Tax=Nocardia sp. CA-145437 TaxID=3239980 RepID=UPI003D99F251